MQNAFVIIVSSVPLLISGKSGDIYVHHNLSVLANKGNLVALYS